MVIRNTTGCSITTGMSLLRPMPSTFTALHGAISGGHSDAVRILLEIGKADPTIRVGSVDVDKGRIGVSPLETALKKGKNEIVDLLYAKIGARGVSVDDLKAAAQKKNFAFFDRVVEDEPSLLNEATNTLGERLAHVAVKSLDGKTLDVLKRRGVEFGKSRTLDGHSTLFSACKENKLNVVKWLLQESGGEVTQSDLSQCLSISCGLARSKNIVSLLMPLVKVDKAKEGEYYASCLQRALDVGNNDVCLMLVETLVEKIDFQYVQPWSSFLLYYVTAIGDPSSLRRVVTFLIPNFDAWGPAGCDARRDLADALLSTLELPACKAALQEMMGNLDEKFSDDEKFSSEKRRLEDLLGVVSNLETRLVEIVEEQKSQGVARSSSGLTPKHKTLMGPSARSVSGASDGRTRRGKSPFRSLL